MTTVRDYGDGCLLREQFEEHVRNMRIALSAALSYVYNESRAVLPYSFAFAIHVRQGREGKRRKIAQSGRHARNDFGRPRISYLRVLFRLTTPNLLHKSKSSYRSRLPTRCLENQDRCITDRDAIENMVPKSLDSSNSLNRGYVTLTIMTIRNEGPAPSTQEGTDLENRPFPACHLAMELVGSLPL